jgi:hypothetical protein
MVGSVSEPAIRSSATLCQISSGRFGDCHRVHPAGLASAIEIPWRATLSRPRSGSRYERLEGDLLVGQSGARD